MINQQYELLGYRMDINRFFVAGDYDVYVDLETKSGDVWDGLHVVFRAWEYN